MCWAVCQVVLLPIAEVKIEGTLRESGIAIAFLLREDVENK